MWRYFFLVNLTLISKDPNFCFSYCFSSEQVCGILWHNKFEFLFHRTFLLVETVYQVLICPIGSRKSSILCLFQWHVSFSLRVCFCAIISLLFRVKKPKLLKTSDRTVLSYLFSFLLLKNREKIYFAAWIILLQRFSDNEIINTFIHLFIVWPPIRCENEPQGKQTISLSLSPRNVRYASIAFHSDWKVCLLPGRYCWLFNLLFAMNHKQRM